MNTDKNVSTRRQSVWIDKELDNQQTQWKMQGLDQVYPKRKGLLEKRCEESMQRKEEFVLRANTETIRQEPSCFTY